MRGRGLIGDGLRVLFVEMDRYAIAFSSSFRKVRAGEG